ncbi:RRQRL motif-containing zinc-binding protein [Nocardia nova]|uniref:RRQRL motif-containing zinc-binding protein n=1 Tax=Nocardia nova TaxID=37330 RepID=UPI00371C4829
MAPLETASEAADPQIYPWKAAPSHLKTRRQLRAAGLAPGGHAPVAQTETRRRGRRLLAYLYDSRLAVPKRTASPAQLLAVAKAIREHQARAAERHGYDRDELGTTEDPGPGWTPIPETTTHEEGITMSDTTQREVAAWQLGTPSGHGQRIAHLLAMAGVNQARSARTEIQRDYDRAQAQGTGAAELFEEGIGHQLGYAEERLQQIAWSNRWSLTGSLAEALTWHDTSEIAAEKLDELRNAFADQWGVVIDTEQMQVSIDPDFDPIAAQARAEASALFARQSAAIAIIEDLPMDPEIKPVVTQALLRWRGESIDEEPAAALARAEERHTELMAELNAAGISGADRARVDFVTDYLTMNTREVDLLASPVFVDPGEEVRGRIPELLFRFREDQITPQQMAAEISMMTEADQAQVREVGKAIRAGREPGPRLWPGYADRDDISEEIFLLAGDIEDLRAISNYVAENDLSDENPETWGVRDETAETIERLRERSDGIVADATLQHGLADVERRQLLAIVDDVAAGRIQSRKDMPELLFADERSKQRIDQGRVAAVASELASAMVSEVGEILADTGMDTQHRRIVGEQTRAVRDTVFFVAEGALTNGIAAERRRFLAQRADLDRALSRAGVGDEQRDQVRTTIAAAAHQAGIAGRAAAERNQQWGIKSERIAMMRDDQADQRRAAAAGRSVPHEAAVSAETVRACTAQVNQHLGSGVAAGPAGLRQLHETGIER